MDKTVKTYAYFKSDNGPGQKSDLADDKNNSPEPALKEALFEAEKNKAVEQLKVIDLLKQNLSMEQNKNAGLVKKVADLEGKLAKLATSEDDQLSQKNAQLEEEKKKSSAYLKTINELMESLKIEQGKSTELERKIAFQETKAKELAEVLSTISNIAAGV
jgi:hypothetical protein